jgi:hypothetical protein
LRIAKFYYRKRWKVFLSSFYGRNFIKAAEVKMKSIEQKIQEDITCPSGVEALDVVEYRPSAEFDQLRLPGYSFVKGDYILTDGFGSCIYRPLNGDFQLVWVGGVWANQYDLSRPIPHQSAWRREPVGA